MSEQTIWTYEDAIEHLLDSVNVDRSGRNLRIAKRALSIAMNDFPNRTKWTHYKSETLLRSESQFTEGSGVDWTEASKELTLVNVAESWPENARYYRVIIGNTHYRIRSRSSDTTVVLTSDASMGGDQSALAFTAYRPGMFLPVDFRRNEEILDVEQRRSLSRVSSAEQHARSTVYWDSPGTPWAYNIRNDGEIYAGMEVMLTPPPSSARDYSVLYEREPRPLRTYSEQTGTVSAAADSTTVSGTGTAFSANHVGCCIRFSSDGTVPTGPFGIRSSGGDIDNPYFAQRIIQSVSTTESLTIDAAIGTLLSGVKYTISDPIDVRPGSMLSAFLKLAEYEYSRLVLRKDADEKHRQYLEAEMRARADDRLDISGDSVSAYQWWRNPTITKSG